MTERTCCSSCTAPAAPAARKRDRLPPGTQSLRLHIEAMDCPTEEALLRRALGDTPGIERLDFDLVNRVLTVHHRNAVEEAIERRIASTGMSARR